MKIIGITGKPGSGKDVLADWLCEHEEMEKLSFGDRVRDYAEYKGIERTRDNLQDLAREIIEENGPDFLAEQMIRKIKNAGKKKAVLSGVRTPADAQTLRNHFKKNFILAAVQTDSIQERFRRNRTRDQDRDTQSYEEFIWEDQKEEQRFQVNKTIEMADVVIPNNGTLMEFKILIRARLLPLLHNDPPES